MLLREFVAIGGMIQRTELELEPKDLWPLEGWADHRAGWIGGADAGFR
eukprot:gene11897-7882_t